MNKSGISFTVVLLLSLVILYFSFSCDEHIRQDELKPLSQKEQILKMIDSKIKRSNDEKEIGILKDFKYDIIFRVRDEAKTNG